MKKCFFALISFLIIFCSANVFALSISAADNLPSNGSWSFSIAFDAMDFWKTQVSLDGAIILTAYSDGAQFLTPFTENKQFVIASGYSSLNLSASMNGLTIGSHSLNVKTFNADGSEKQSADKTLNVFDVLTSSYKQETDSKLQATESKLQATETKLQEANSKLAEAQSKLSSLDSQVSGFSSQVSGVSENVSSFSSSINSLKTSISEFDSLLKSKDVTIAEIQSALDKLSEAIEVLELETKKLNSTDANTVKNLSDIKKTVSLLKKDLDEQKASSIFSGLASLTGSSTLNFLLIALAVIAVIVLVMFTYRKVKEDRTLFSSGYSSSGKGSTKVSSSDEDDEDEDDEQGDDVQVKNPKFAYKGEYPFGPPSETENKKGFHLGDLIKRKEK